ncbi:SDR family oxidoreductase [Dyadobacter sediminis]|uniref:SDR family oxidoreductase n=1 Tax=Dyadobacter sediminis TaxID=1493691 RepID=A0A5R9KCA8_9BACT|nr:SDR family oxidoreductase [Dyadobacter sediminis]TLU92369.1 SDR family oxidoreductase [Dyadobacter sediminis]
MKRTALITGANKSIGFETARQLLSLNYSVYIGSRDAEKGLKAVEQLKSEGFEDVDMLQIDVTDAASIHAAAAELTGKVAQLDVLVNNAGIPGVMPQNASEITQENLRNIFDTNFFGVVQTTQAFIPLLKKSDEPRIVNVSSDLGSLGNHTNPDYAHFDVKVTGYCSSKTALNAFTVMLAYEFRDSKFKINSVNPGYTATDFNGHTGYKKVEEAAEVVVRYAIIGADGPNGKFFSDYGETPW